MLFFTAIVLGILSSFHCLGMCGPIALATPVINKNEFTQFFSRLIYNLGRTFSYLIIGLFAGLAGKGLYMAGIQQSLSIFAGLVLFIWIVIPKLNPENWKKLNNNRILSKIKSSIQYYFQQKKYSSIFIIGTLNGLLPCGMVYMALVGAIATGNIWQGGLYMFLFGVGTWPVFFALTAAWKYITIPIRNRMRQITPVFIGILAFMFILRGLNLGIPYISPKIHKIENESVSTCNASLDIKK